MYILNTEFLDIPNIYIIHITPEYPYTKFASLADVNRTDKTFLASHKSEVTTANYMYIWVF